MKTTIVENSERGTTLHSTGIDPLKPLTTPELAARLSVSTRTIQNWRDNGKLPYIRVTARSIRYVWEQVLRSLAKK